MFIVSARYGLIPIDQVLSPYDCFLGDFSHHERQSWASFIAACLRHEGMILEDEIWLHTDNLYKDYLISALDFYGVTIGWIDFKSYLKNSVYDKKDRIA